jgi:hypothetical protein
MRRKIVPKIRDLHDLEKAVMGQSMRNRPKRVATKSPISLKILSVIGLYVKFNMCKGFFFLMKYKKSYGIFNF